ncbi:uncharacterized protein LOC126656725 [Mercurialis annua]|uniref:uncharacterized protein LOC126656725 n=1 Tax=Mercurialis annua TaxID=3986 RepID=UPI00216020FA|nr:uncharacterized protein LOC126656725 [Mercurialis annua]
MDNPRAIRLLKNMDKTKKSNLIFLSESFVTSIRVEALRVALEYEGCFVGNCKKRKGGLVVSICGKGTTVLVEERLDMALCLYSWVEMFKSIEFYNLDVTTSDYKPIIVKYRSGESRKSVKQFRFENIWVAKEDCRSVINSSWRSACVMGIMQRVANVQVELEGWSRNIRPKFGSLIFKKEEELSLLQNRTDMPGDMRLKMCLKELHGLLEKGEMYWKQRAKKFWLKEMDFNTKYFNNSATRRKRNSRILRLKSDTCD